MHKGKWASIPYCILFQGLSEKAHSRQEIKWNSPPQNVKEIGVSALFDQTAVLVLVKATAAPPDGAD
jgi:hypothetical protein